jgi:hypothetical protein
MLMPRWWWNIWNNRTAYGGLTWYARLVETN